MKIKLLLLFSFLFITKNLIAQNFVLGGTVNYAKSKISYTSRGPDNSFKGFATSLNTGFFLESKINKKNAWGIEALWVQIEEVDESYATIASTVGSQQIMTGTHIALSYFGLPVYYKYQFRKFGFKGGIQTMLYLRGSSYSYTYANQFIDGDYRAKFDNLKTFDLGFKFGIDYRLSEKMSLRIDYYHGQTNIFSIVGFYPRSNRQASAGVNFIFGKNQTDN